MVNRRLKNTFKRVRNMPPMLRLSIGLVLLLGGALWFLPVVGLWMIPLGLLVLSADFVWARRGYLSLWLILRRWRERRRGSRT